MRRLLFIKPDSGWSDFVTELVIVVLGVFIALGAQQAVDDWNSRRRLAEFTKAVDRELADNLAAYEQRIAQSRCANARLDQLELWQSDWRDGTGPAMVSRIRRPIGMTLRRDVWDSGAAGSVADMPLNQRLAYAGLYSALQTYDNLRLREAATWEKLYSFDEAAQLSSADINELRGLILTARSLAWSIDGNWIELKREASSMGIKSAAYVPEPLTERICIPIQFAEPLRPAGAGKGRVPA